MDKLPPDLKQYVKEDNELFGKEIEEWDALQARKAQQEKLALATAAADASATASISTSSSSPQPMSIDSSPPDNTGQGPDTQNTQESTQLRINTWLEDKYRKSSYERMRK